MSKAVLILDMPSSCDVCYFTDMANGKIYCGVPGCGKNTEDYIACRPEWCPLRELPNPKEKGKAENILEIFSNAGYNACIDELLKGEDG